MSWSDCLKVRQDQATRRPDVHGAKRCSDLQTNQGKRIGVVAAVGVDTADGLAEAGNPKAIGVGWKRLGPWLNGFLTSGCLGFAGVLGAPAAVDVSSKASQ